MAFLSGSKPRQKRRGTSRVLPNAVSGPWKGTFAQRGTDAVYRGGDLLYSMQNMYIADAAHGSACRSRPSVTRLGSLQLGSGGNRNGQCVYNHTRPDGTEDRLLFAGGKMYRWNGSTTSPSVSDITPGAVTINTTGRIWCLTFAGVLIVNDGVNKPWKYDPATSTATYIDIDSGASAWVAYGPPVVYGGKLMFVLKSKGGTTFWNTFVWSEEADPSIGYYQTGYTNFWTLFQTGADRLIRLVATNAGLYYFRPDSIGFITGTVNAAFQTSAQHDAVSSNIGTVTPDAVTLVNEDIYFLDRYVRQWRIARSGLEPLYKALDDVAPSGNAPADTNTSFYYAEYGLVLTHVLAADTSARHVWDVATGASFYVWFMPIQAIRATGILRDDAGNPNVVMIGQDYDNSEGYVYRFRRLNEAVATTFDDSLWSAGGGTLYRRTIGIVLGDDLERQQRFTKLTAEVFNAIQPSTSTFLLSSGGTDYTATSTSMQDTFGDRVTWGMNVFGRRWKFTLSIDDRSNVDARFSRVIADRIDEGEYPDGA